MRGSMNNQFQIYTAPSESNSNRVNSEQSSSFVLDKLISSSENSKLEFKGYGYPFSGPLELTLMKTICGFLNRQGGTILIGVNDDKKVVGINLNGRVDEVKLYFDKLKRSFFPIPMGLIETVEVPVRRQVGDNSFVWVPNLYILRVQVQQGIADRYYTFMNQNKLFSAFREDASTQLISELDQIQEKIYQRSKNPMRQAEMLIYEDPDQAGLGCLQPEKIGPPKKQQQPFFDYFSNAYQNANFSSNNQAPNVFTNNSNNNNNSNTLLANLINQQNAITNQNISENQKNTQNINPQNNNNFEMKNLFNNNKNSLNPFLQQSLEEEKQDNFFENKENTKESPQISTPTKVKPLLSKTGEKLLLFPNVLKQKADSFIEQMQKLLLQNGINANFIQDGMLIVAKSACSDIELFNAVTDIYEKFKFAFTRLTISNSELLFGYPQDFITVKCSGREDEEDIIAKIASVVNCNATMKGAKNGKNEVKLSDIDTNEDLCTAFNYFKAHKMTAYLQFQKMIPNTM